MVSLRAPLRVPSRCKPSGSKRGGGLLIATYTPTCPVSSGDLQVNVGDCVDMLQHQKNSGLPAGLLGNLDHCH